MTSAATTEYCFEKLEGPHGQHLWMDGNGKITAGNGTMAEPKPNAFSLLQVSDCPYATETCKKACYVHNLEEAEPELHAMYAHNSKTIREILAQEDWGNFYSWSNEVARWIRHNCTEFRWHVSGDVFSSKYAKWIVEVCRLTPNVTHWIYTRSFPYVEILVKADNLVVNLSADKDNYGAARMCSAANGPGHSVLRICYLTEDGTIPAWDLIKGDVIFPDYGLRGDDSWYRMLPAKHKRMVCPVDYRGKSEKLRCGPCRKCMV